MNPLTGTFQQRLRESISFAWLVFQNKVGTGLLPINKEASMQLHYSNVLQQVIPLICFNQDESIKIELESSICVDDRPREIDLVLIGNDSQDDYKIAVEMKCYRKIASSGKPRGAHDIFMKDVYIGLELLEDYCEHAGFDRGVLLVMNDHNHFVNPTRKTGKCWHYDISNGYKITDGIHLKTPIGGKQIDIRLNKSYDFNWVQCGDFWFMENEGMGM